MDNGLLNLPLISSFVVRFVVPRENNSRRMKPTASLLASDENDRLKLHRMKLTSFSRQASSGPEIRGLISRSLKWFAGGPRVFVSSF